MTIQHPPAPRGFSRRGFLQLGGGAALVAAAGPALTACSGGGDDITFMYWGSAYEQTAIKDMLGKYNEEKSNEVPVNGQYTPVGDYETKISSLVAANTPPDIGYLGVGQMYDLAGKDQLLNLYDYVDAYPELTDRLPSSYFWYGPDKLAANQLAMGMQILYFNTDSFEAAGLERPPFEATSAWSWDEFVEAAIALTLDDEGRNPSESGFDASNVAQFGTIAPFGGGGLNALLASNGAGYVSEDGLQYTLDSAEAITVLQNIQDLVYEHRVAPSPAQLGKNAPTTSVQLQTQRVAMIVDGNWAMLDLLESEVPFGVAVLPQYQVPLTATGGAAGAIFAATEHPEEAVELYLYYNDPENVDLFQNGLWAPLQEKYYTDEAEIAKWVGDDFPEHFREVAIDTTLNHGVTNWDQQTKNSDSLWQKITPAMESLQTGDATAEEVAQGLREEIEPLLEGTWPVQEL
ncbi:extracellular solute-binding protein family 1 [Beutenbergia cavernae DSM 12333]|uniref:Extracellular solute-binding protein family 1 n=1 Tax=Beutenbergia cavernae (strain ATCC BAA-8 / DSM 12333 / CCUG 43141 / JCM 11478 / NBRC 16432 / NCIMB 13614 / HKI 0122) TaxID=471853 RepID=C5C4B1_BEUC1|nr:extracellular solute-binding protein [Beutenbergia cavernae]ACQ82035.1 extracellular solute-binding protein family 1 [Beutenbergia cavernae DSM 12333]